MDALSGIHRNIVREILRECYPKKLKLNEHFVEYFVKLLLLNPTWGITDNFMNSRSNVQNLVKYAMGHLVTPNDLQQITLKMQFFFTCTLENIQSFIDHKRRKMVHRLAPLKEDICRMHHEQPSDLLRKKIAIFTILLSGLGNPLEDMVYEEALAALKSVMWEEELHHFMGSPKHIKEAQLEQINKVICGIRLFNKDCDKGGAGVPNLPDLLDRAVTVIKDEVESLLLVTMEKVNLLTTIVDKSYVLHERDDHIYTIKCRPLPEMTTTQLEKLKDTLILFRQYELFVRKTIEELNNLEERASDLYVNLDNLLKKIHRTLNMRIAVPVSIIFPLFEELSTVWVSLQNLVILLAKLHKAVKNLDSYTTNVPFDKYYLESILKDNLVFTDAERMEQTSHRTLKSYNEEVQIFRIENFQNIDNVHLQYLGFCCWKMVETNGGLVPGNPSIGIAKYRNKNFVFSSPEAFQGFSANPDEYIKHVLDLARKKPKLINFLMLKDELLQVIGVNQLVRDKSITKIVKDKETQMENIYTNPANIDRQYKWNVWDLKREALLLANISKRKTISTQTWKSHSINTMKTQTFLKYTQGTQTKHDSYSNVPKPLSHIFGLRGRKDDKQFVIDLTQYVTK